MTSILTYKTKLELQDCYLPVNGNHILRFGVTNIEPIFPGDKKNGKILPICLKNFHEKTEINLLMKSKGPQDIPVLCF